MSDDTVTKFLSQAKAPPQDGSPRPTLPASLVPFSTHDRQPYKAFDNKIRTPSVQIRCFRTGVSCSMDYAQMSNRIFEFLTGEILSFSGGGHGVAIKGRSLGDLLLAIDLQTCGFIQDFHPNYFLPLEPDDTNAPFIESIDIVVLRPTPTPAERRVSAGQSPREREGTE